jgi:hypothetical protein
MAASRELGVSLLRNVPDGGGWGVTNDVGSGFSSCSVVGGLHRNGFSRCSAAVGIADACSNLAFL